MADRRKDLMVYHYDPKRKFFLVSLSLENKPGALGNIANILGVRGINMLEGYFGGIEGDIGTLSFFVESTNPKMDREWLEDFIKSSVMVTDVIVKEGVEGFLADSQNFPLTWNDGSRAIAMEVDDAKKMLGAVVEAAGSKGSEILFKAGFQHGKSAAQALLSTFAPKSKEAVFEIIHIFTAIGWGKFEVREYDPKKNHGVVRVLRSFECEGVESPTAHSCFVRGNLAGAVSAFMGTDVKCAETKCLAKGDDFCEFELTP